MSSKLKIRKAQISDAIKIADLLTQLGYPQNLQQLDLKLQQILDEANEYIFVAEYEQNVCGFISLYFIPQIALDGDFARISYLCIDQQFRNLKVGEQLLQYAEALARQHGCDRMELHCAEYRTEAHRFYFRHNYVESPKYLMKKIASK